MTGLINKTARQLDLRSRDAGGLIHVVLNPGFNIVDDDTWEKLLQNKHNQVLVDEGAIVAGAKKTKVDEDAEREQAAREASLEQVDKPTAAAAVVPVKEESKDPNINPETGKPYTAAQLKKLEKEKGKTDLDL